MTILTLWYRHISVHQGQDYDGTVSTPAVLMANTFEFPCNLHFLTHANVAKVVDSNFFLSLLFKRLVKELGRLYRSVFSIALTSSTRVRKGKLTILNARSTSACGIPKLVRYKKPILSQADRIEAATALGSDSNNPKSITGIWSIVE